MAIAKLLALNANAIISFYMKARNICKFINFQQFSDDQQKTNLHEMKMKCFCRHMKYPRNLFTTLISSLLDNQYNFKIY